MKLRVFYFLLITSCSTFIVAQETSTTTIPIEVQFGDTFHYEFGYFGDEEGIVLEQEPLFAEYYELSGLQWELRTFHYQPQNPITPSDSAILVEFRGSDGAGPSLTIDTTIFVFNPLIDAVFSTKSNPPNCWPNPHEGELLNTNLELKEYRLFNSSGILIQQGITSIDGQISMSDIPQGLFYLYLNGSTQKIVRL